MATWCPQRPHRHSPPRPALFEAPKAPLGLRRTTTAPEAACRTSPHHRTSEAPLCPLSCTHMVDRQGNHCRPVTSEDPCPPRSLASSPLHFDFGSRLSSIVGGHMECAPARAGRLRARHKGRRRVYPIQGAPAGDMSEETRRKPGVPRPDGRAPTFAGNGQPHALAPESRTSPTALCPRATSSTRQGMHGGDVGRPTPLENPCEN